MSKRNSPRSRQIMAGITAHLMRHGTSDQKKALMMVGLVEGQPDAASTVTERAASAKMCLDKSIDNFNTTRFQTR